MGVIVNRKIILLIAIIAVLVVGVALMMNTSKQESKIDVVSNGPLHMGSTFLVKLTDLNNNPIAKENVSIVIYDGNSNAVVDKQVKTDDQGIASLELDDISSGNYKVNITFKGNDKFKNSTLTYNLTVEESSIEPVQINTDNVNQTSTTNTTTNSSQGNSNQGNSNSGSGSFYSAQSGKTYYTGEVDLAPDGHHYKHVGNGEWIRID